MITEIALDLLGSFRVRVNGKPLESKQFKLRHSRQLLQMLALQPDLQLAREQVLETLWPQSDLRAASNRLHNTVHILRGVFTDAGVGKEEAVVILQAGVVLTKPLPSLHN
jgi:DNA-binding SARP family transcriptional activator